MENLPVNSSIYVAVKRFRNVSVTDALVICNKDFDHSELPSRVDNNANNLTYSPIFTIFIYISLYTSVFMCYFSGKIMP